MENNTNIKFAVLHNHLFVPALGQYGPTLTLGNAEGKSTAQKMTLSGNFLTITIKNTDIILPLTSVSHMVAGK